MREAERADAQLTDSGWPTNPLEARFEGGTAAETTITDDTLILHTFDLDALPTDPITITGIGVRIDAKKTDSGGTALLRIGIELSWDSGSTWTAIKKTPVLAAQYGSYMLGGPADLWGHAWTRAELAGVGTLRLRLTASADVVSGSPIWHVLYCRPTVFYDRTSSVTIRTFENIGITEQVLTNPRMVQTFERIDVFDSGSSRTGTTVLGRLQQHLKLSGTAITSLQSSAGFPASITRPRHREGIGCRLRSEAIGFDVFIGDSVLLTAGDGLTYPGNLMQAGMLDLGEVTSEGNFQGETRATSCELRLMNRYYVNQKAGAAATARKLSEIVNQQPIIGGSLTVWSFTESGDGWMQYVIFEGVIEELDFEKSSLIVRGIAAGTGAIPVPDIFVDDDLFTYEPGSSALDTGEQVKGTKGRVVPIGIGRFDYGAVKLPNDFADGHPFRSSADPLSPDDRKNRTNIALFPAMFGLKHPMMPTIHVASRYRRVTADGTAFDKFTSFPYQNVFLYGSRKSAPHFGVATSPSGNLFGFNTQRFPGSDSNITAGALNRVDYGLIWTWHQSEERSVGMPMALARGAMFRNDLIAVVDPPRFPQNHVGCQFMEHLGYPNPLTAPNWTDGTARHAFGIFANNLTPPLSQFPSIHRWPGVLQIIALPMAGPTKLEQVTRIFLETNTYTPKFSTMEGTGTGFVENMRNCLDLSDVENFTRINTGGSLSLQAPLSASSLGKIRGVRFCLAWNNVTSTTDAVYLFARFGPSVNYAFQRTTGAGGHALNAETNKDFGVEHNQADIIDPISGNAVPCYKLSNPDGTPFASVWMLPDFDGAQGRPYTLFDDSTFEAPALLPTTRYLPRKGRREWQFTSMDLAAIPGSVGAGSFVEWPWDFMIQVRTSGFLDVIAVWMEVVFESPLNGSRPEAITNTIYAPRLRRFRPFSSATEWIAQPTSSVTFEREARIGAPSPLYVTGKGAVDDADGSITGTAYSIIENPADIARALIRHYAGEAVFSKMAMGSTFGSFATARSQLAAIGYRLAVVVDEAETLGQVLRRVAAQSRSLIVEQTNDLGETIWRMFVDVASPPAERLYRGGFFFGADEMAEGTFQVQLTRYEEIANQVSVQFGLHHPTRTYSDEKYCSPTASNFATGAATYQAALATTQRQYGTTRRITITAPDVWDPAVAERLCKWHIDQVRRKRVAVEFETFANAMDLKPGHVIKIKDALVPSDPTLGIPYPGDSAAWELVSFTVTQVSMRKDAGQLARIFVRAEEVATEAI